MANAWGGKRLGAGRKVGSKNRKPRPLKDTTLRLLLSRGSAARALGISVRMIDAAIASGLLDARRLNDRILIPADSLVKFAAADQAIPGAFYKGWGGRRAGAGRKFGSKAKPARVPRL
jgi:hypothetical protein